SDGVRVTVHVFDPTFSIHEPEEAVHAAGGARLDPVLIQRIVRASFEDYRRCYQAGLGKDPALRGRVVIRFVIGIDGAVSGVQDGGSDLPDPAVIACVLGGFKKLSFPPPTGGEVTVTYPIDFMSP